MKKILILLLVGVIFALGVLILSSMPKTSTVQDGGPLTQPNRLDKIPSTAVKATPGGDDYPPILHSGLYEDPVPLTAGVNTAGGEDSPFITPDGGTLYFFFTPDVSVPAEKQILDGVTGIYQSKKHANGTWSVAEKIILQDKGKIAIDGAEFVQGDTMYFASVREGYSGIHWFRAEYVDGRWRNWQLVDSILKKDEYETGELHISPDGKTLYFHSPREGGMGGLDIWYFQRLNDSWSPPVNLAPVNTADDEGWPAMSPDGGEFWFTRTFMGSPAVYRSRFVNGSWGPPRLIVSQFAGEPSIDSEGNIYFVHHYYRNSVMLEADIYVAKRMKTPLKPVDAAEPQAGGFLTACLPMPAEGRDLAETYKQASASVDLVPVWGRPTAFYDLAADLRGAWGELFVDDLIRGNGMAPIIELSFMGENLTLQSPQSLGYSALSSPLWRRAYLQAALEAVRAARPRYLSLGNEVNRWYEKYGLDGDNGFQNYVSLYNEVYDAVKELSPETRVFCTFAREIVSENREADLGVLSLFDPARMDLLAFTSYPHAVKGTSSPSSLPDDYYTRALNHMPGKPLAFTELGWPSIEAFGGEAGQASFLVQVTGRLTRDRGASLSVVGWCWLSDLTAEDHVGLITRSGEEKEAYRVWLSLSG